VAKKEGLTLPDPLANRIAAASNRDMRRAIMSLEVCYELLCCGMLFSSIRRRCCNAYCFLHQ
jgi:DNA polymerase III delta prime subunit